MVLTPPLRWRGDDAFDGLGRRMATVARWSHSVPTRGDGNLRDTFWQAHVANETVWADGRERFEDRASAQAAAERAYRDLVLAAGDPSAVPAFPDPNRAGRGLGASVKAAVARKIRRRSAGPETATRARPNTEPDWNAPPRRAAPPRQAVPVPRTADPISRAPGLLGTFVQSRRR